MAAPMSFLSWFLLGWAVVSAVATPLVARLVSYRFSDDEPEQAPLTTLSAPSPTP
jgi:hypothetical protein